ncbi:hypothetical protein COCNU_03G004150 [Cocos nucifera]|uniref:Uncharacterized protein n=1 Tax=Cocos nucifera TaxID=13894 RepID=A0A8K0I2P6_COCNU|nr:hypothetical protein COCNU_03G004150 [Cocos nucifera]
MMSLTIPPSLRHPTSLRHPPPFARCIPEPEVSLRRQHRHSLLSLAASEHLPSLDSRPLCPRIGGLLTPQPSAMAASSPPSLVRRIQASSFLPVPLSWD